MRRIVCVVEGHGDVQAIPQLCKRILREMLSIDGASWAVELPAIRHQKYKLVDRAQIDSRRPTPFAPLHRILRQALSRKPDALLITCDADDDCPAAWSRQVPRESEIKKGRVRIRAVMASREYESWLLAGLPREQRKRARALDPDRAPRDAKTALATMHPGYGPATHQLKLTQELNLRRAWAVSDSFDKLVRSLAELVGAAAPRRPREQS